MTQIQDEIARLQVMANDLLTALPKSEMAKRMAGIVIPDIEILRAAARAEIEGDGLSSESYDVLSSAMTAAEELAWAIDRADQLPESKLVCRQFDNIHIMMNALDGLPVPESHKCWPPEDPNCS